MASWRGWRDLATYWQGMYYCTVLYRLLLLLMSGSLITPVVFGLACRLLVLAAVPSPCRGRGPHVLAFLLAFSRQVNRHVPPLWTKRIPLLQMYLRNHLVSGAAAGGDSSSLAPSWDQGQWELWLMELLDDTVREIGLEEWNGALVSCCLCTYVCTVESSKILCSTRTFLCTTYVLHTYR